MKEHYLPIEKSKIVNLKSKCTRYFQSRLHWTFGRLIHGLTRSRHILCKQHLHRAFAPYCVLKTQGTTEDHAYIPQ